MCAIAMYEVFCHLVKYSKFVDDILNLYFAFAELQGEPDSSAGRRGRRPHRAHHVWHPLGGRRAQGKEAPTDSLVNY